MNDGKKLLLSSSVASMAAPILFSGFFFAGSGQMPQPDSVLFVFVVAWIVTIFHLMFLGLPLFVLMQRYRRLGWLDVTLAGFIAGFVPIGVLSCPLLSVGSKTSMIWLHYIIGCLPYALLGVITSIVLWRVLLKVDDKKNTPVVGIVNAGH